MHSETDNYVDRWIDRQTCRQIDSNQLESRRGDPGMGINRHYFAPNKAQYK